MLERGDAEQLCERRHCDEKRSKISLTECIHRELHLLLLDCDPESTYDITICVSTPNRNLSGV